MKKHILLSICIPTYNRPKNLDKTLFSITNQRIFQETNDVEIVISDNCSENNTNKISEKYIEIYGSKVRYYRTPENIGPALNLERALSYGNGEFLKLNNDTLMHHEDSLEIIIKEINQNIEDKDILFFSNGVLKKITKVDCEDLDSFVKTVSYWSTWIACFGIWKKDFNTIDRFSRNANLLLVQTDILLRLISSDRPVHVINSKIFDIVSPEFKGGYNIYQVFVTNYLGLLENYRETRQISRITLFNEKTKILFNFLIPWTLNILGNRSKYHFETNDFFKRILDKYMFHPALYVSPFYFTIMWFKRKLKKCYLN